MVLRRMALTLAIYSIWIAFGCCQTIHEDDVDYFIGAFKVEDSAGTRIIDVTHFEKYFLTKHYENRRAVFDSMKCHEDRHWVYDWQMLSAQNGEVKCGPRRQYCDEKSLNYRLYIMMDYCGHELQQNVLTVWELFNCDSLRYICGQAGPFNSSIGSARVRFATVFPDSSLLLVVDYGGEGYGGTGFFRGATPDNFRRFYYDEWRFDWESYTPGKYTDIEFDFYGLLGMSVSYEVWETAMYKTVVPDTSKPHGDHFIITIDSTAVHPLDLWRLAKEYFNIAESR
jgi:hypothetical protein